jgi:parallel beta-helix repeat protein
MRKNQEGTYNAARATISRHPPEQAVTHQELTLSDNVIPVDGMRITEDTRLAPGVYALSQGLIIDADNVTIDGTGALLVNQSHQGAGLRAEGRRGITIRGIGVSGFYHGIRLDHCQDVTIEQVTLRNTAEIAGIDTFLYLWNPIDAAYSGAILLHDVQNGTVRGCDLQHQMNGVLLYGCTDVKIEKINASFNSGWGVYLNASNSNTIEENQLDFCNRVYRRPESGAIRVEADAAAIVLVEGSSSNKLLRNSCLCGGDGIFIAGYNHKGGKRPCNDNLIEGNDCRLSPNNAIESTFSQGNIFRHNDCSQSNYGFWMGYSWDNVIEDNTVEFSRRVGIAIEHGHRFEIRDNKILRNGEGIRLFTRGGGVLPYWPGWEVSYDFKIEGNVFETNGIGFNGYTGSEIVGQDGHDYILKNNTFRDNRTAIRFHRVYDCVVDDNTFQGNVENALLLIDKPGVRLGDNRFEHNQADVVETTLS